MTILIGRFARGGRGGSGIAYGPAPNTFGSNTSDITATPFTGTPATNRAAAETTRNNYFTANASHLTEYNGTNLAIALFYEDGANRVITSQIYVNSAWTDISTVIAFQGADGAGTDFSGITANHVPAINSLGQPYDSGLMVDANGDLITPKSLQTGPGSIRIGPGFTVSNGVMAMALDMTGQKAIGLNVEYDTNGSTAPFYYRLAAEQTLDVNTANTQALTDPFTLAYQTFGDNLTTDFTFIPNAAGDLRVRYWLGTDDTGMLIFDETRTVESSEVGNVTDFGVGNPYILARNTQLFVRFEGIALRGGVVNDPNSPFNTQTLIYFQSKIQPYTKVTLGSGGSTPNPGNTAASITRFDIQGEATSVLAGTTISGTKTFNYNVNHPEDVRGNLTIRQDATVLSSTVNPSSNTISLPVTSVTLQNNNQAVFSLEGITNEGASLQQYFRIRAHLPADRLYYGATDSTDPATVDISGFNHVESGINGSKISTGTTTAGQRFMILVPASHDLVGIIDFFNNDVTSIFTRTANVRMLNGVNYNSYVVGPLTAGNPETYTLRY